MEVVEKPFGYFLEDELEFLWCGHIWCFLRENGDRQIQMYTKQPGLESVYCPIYAQYTPQWANSVSGDTAQP